MDMFKDAVGFPLMLAGTALLAQSIPARPPAATVQAAATSAPKAQGTSPRLITVEAEGSGPDRAAALGQALRNAVLQAVGAVVDGKTAIDRERLVEDRIVRAPLRGRPRGTIDVPGDGHAPLRGRPARGRGHAHSGQGRDVAGPRRCAGAITIHRLRLVRCAQVRLHRSGAGCPGADHGALRSPRALTFLNPAA